MWFHKAARNDHVQAKFYMGLSFAQGVGVKQQLELARYWFKLAAKAGHAEAVAYLANL
jgi:TPR repeat protein